MKLLLPVLMTGFLLAPEAAQAQGLDPHVTTLAKRIADVCKEDGYTSVVIKFDPPKSSKPDGDSLYPGSGSQMFSTLLAEKLQSPHKLEVKKFRANIKLMGEILITEFGDEGDTSGKTTGIAIEVSVRFVDRSGQPIVNVRIPKVEITDAGTMAQILGIPFEDPTPDPKPGMDPIPDPKVDPVVNGFTDPKQNAGDNGHVNSGKGTYEIQLLRNGQPVPVGTEDGLAFMELHKGDEFSVKLINHDSYEVGVQLTLDGVDSFYFTKSKKGLWLVPPNDHIVVPGWQLDGKTAKKFTVVPYEESVAVKLGYLDQLGVIQACFSRTWDPEGQVPPGEYGKQRPIGSGHDIDNPVKFVNRKVGRVRASIPIRYER